MTIDASTFLTSFPEFADAPATLVTAKLAEATSMVPDRVWGAAATDPVSGGGSLTQQATFLYCAHFLALSPFARNMALVDTAGSTLYEKRLDRLRRTVASGYRVC